MRLTMSQKQAVTKKMSTEYKRASKKRKGEIIIWLMEIGGYKNRFYVAKLLRLQGSASRKTTRRLRPKKYNEQVLESLIKIWAIYDCICGKRLCAVMNEAVCVLEKFEEIKLSDNVREKVLTISASTIDRLLKDERKKFELKGRSLTKPGSLLKHQIPIRTFADWDEDKPGFAEIDLVGHEGGLLRGDYCQSLNAVDIRTTWSETVAVKNKAQKWVFKGIEEIKERLPFDLLGIDSDNGSEFINEHLLRYCAENNITFTRSRPYRKNDNCFIEQKNYSIVRRNVGYKRYDTEKELGALNELYRHLRLYTNFFQPSMKLIEKTRIGACVKKKYDTPKTPYQRVLESVYISDEIKNELKDQYVKLNPAELKRNILKLQQKLSKLALAKQDQSLKQQQISTEVGVLF